MAGSSLSDIFESTWRQRSPHWKAYALRLTRNPADADDVVLEATARTLQTQPDLDSESRLHAYVVAAIRNIAFNVMRNRHRETVFEDGANGNAHSRTSSALQLALSDEATEQRASLGAAMIAEMVHLPDEHREAIELLVLREPPLKLREVAEIQGVTTSTVHYRLNRGLDALAATVSWSSIRS